MNTVFLFITVFLAGFTASFIGTDILARKINFMREKMGEGVKTFFGSDMAKTGRPLVPTMGGIAIAFGFAFSIVLSLRFIGNDLVRVLMAGLVTILLITVIGFLDDIFIVRRIWRIILPGIAAFPLIVIQTGTPTINFFNNEINLGIFYTYLLIPIGVIACANFINILAGFNGLEVGSGAIVNLSLFISSVILMRLEPQKYSVITPAITLSMFGACAAFLIFNWYPARIFPGNVGTYVIGASIAAAAIIGNIEKVAAIALIPQIMEFILKFRNGFKMDNFGRLDGGRLIYEGRVSSLTHFIMKYFKVGEKKLVGILLLIQAACGCLAVWSIFWYR